MSSFAQKEVLGSGGAVVANTELSDPTLLADGKANGSATDVEAKISGFNGSSWDRIRAGLITQTSTPIGFLNSIPFAQYNFTDLTLSDLETAPFQLTSSAFLKIEEQLAPAYESSIGRAIVVEGPTNSGLYAHSTSIFNDVHLGTINAGFANLLSFSFTNFQGSALYLRIFNKATNPSSGAEASDLLWMVGLPAGEISSYKFSGTGLYGSDGLAFFISSSNTTNTAPVSDTLLTFSTEFK